jgi:single-strand DNA-binding protein
MNKITIIGNVGQDPELRFTQGGQANVKMTVATSRKVKEEWVSTWHTVVAWGQLAENIAGSVLKGTRVIVSGRLDVREWTDKNDNKKTSYEIAAEEIGISLKNAMVVVEKNAPKEQASAEPEEAF